MFLCFGTPNTARSTRQGDRMSETESKHPDEQQHGGWSEVKRRLDIELFALAAGITKRQAVDLMKKYREKDYEILRREERRLRD